MKEKLIELKENLIELGISIKAAIKINILIGKIKEKRITESEIIKELSNYDKNFREELIKAYMYTDPYISDILKKANNKMERERRENFINAVKTNTYKEYLSTLQLIQIYDLKEDIIKTAKVTALYNYNESKEYEIALKILEEYESILGIDIPDYKELEKLFETLSPEEIALYMIKYPELILMMELESKELVEKILIATKLLKTKEIKEKDVSELTYNKRKYF